MLRISFYRIERDCPRQRYPYYPPVSRGEFTFENAVCFTPISRLVAEIRGFEVGAATREKIMNDGGHCCDPVFFLEVRTPRRGGSKRREKKR